MNWINVKLTESQAQELVRLVKFEFEFEKEAGGYTDHITPRRRLILKTSLCKLKRAIEGCEV